MSRRMIKLRYLTIAFLLAAFLYEPSPANAAGGGIKIDLRVHGGYSRLAASDVNTGSGGMLEFYKLIAEYGLYEYEGGYKPLHGGYDVGFDFVFLLSPRLGIGIGAGYLRSVGTGDLTLTMETGVLAFESKSVLSALPVRLGLYYALPLRAGLSLTANAGAALYVGRMFNDHFRFEQDVTWGAQDIDADRVGFSDVGFQGGLGVDYRISSTMGIFVEAQGRYAKFKNFGEVSITAASYEGGPQTREGKIYLRSQNLATDPPVVFNTFLVESTPPTPDPPDILIREPKFDFSGFCLQAGVRIRL